MATQLETTIEKLDENIKSKTTTGASVSISSWIKKLSDNEDLKPIADDLEKLKAAISAKDGAEIVTLLDKVGKATIDAASNADDDSSKGVAKLGKALVAGAKAVKTLVK